MPSGMAPPGDGPMPIVYADSEHTDSGAIANASDMWAHVDLGTWKV